MKNTLLVSISLVLMLVSSSYAQTLVKPGTCELIVASRKSVSEAQQYIRKLDDNRFAKIFKASNGWYAISVGSLKPSEEDAVLSNWKAAGKIPQDSYCTTGQKYVAALNWKTGEKIEKSTTRASGESSLWHGWGIQNSGSKWAMQVSLSSSGAKVSYPTLGCLAKWIYLQDQGGKSYYKEIITKQGHRRCAPEGYVAVNLLDSGNLAFQFSKSNRGTPIARAVLVRGEINSSGYSDSQLVQISQRYINGGNKLASYNSGGVGLLGAILLGGIKAIENAGNSSGSSSGSSSNSSSISSLKYGCEFYCEGSFGTARSGKIRANTPHSNFASAQDFIRREYKDYCENNFGFHGGQSRGADVSYPKCETYYYK